MPNPTADVSTRLPRRKRPREERLTAARLIGVSRGDVAGDLGALFEIAADGNIGSRRAGAVGLLITAVTTIETCHDLLPPIAARRLGVDESLHLIAPLLPLVGPAQCAQVVQRTHDLGEPLQVAVIGGGRGLRLRGQRKAKPERSDGQEAFHAIGVGNG